MRIERRHNDRRHPSSLEIELKEFLNFERTDGRPCGAHCQRVCPTCGSTSCQCQCSPDCEHIPTTLSSDPKRYPIEDAIAPLVYVLKHTGHFTPCWSCEGHMDVRGEKIWKIPRVWFYCESVIHVRILADIIQDFSIDKITHVPWEIKISFSDDDNPDTTFSLCPNLVDREDIKLENLQKDVRAIADRLEAALRQRAQKVLESASNPSK